ncbi:isoprenoid synthase domain-containing protein [Mycena vulgaris]|nr:isoprenoid synthase domain-containing protein [Mycena vulgaris]
MAPIFLPLPDLASHSTFSHRLNPHRKGVPAKTKAWFFKGSNPHYDKQCESFNGLNPTLLASACYPDAGHPQLRVCSDFLAYLFYLDNLSNEFDTRETALVSTIVPNSFYHSNTSRSPSRIAQMSKDLFKRICQTSGQGVQCRFIQTFDLFLQSLKDQARDRTSGAIPTLEDYIPRRRDTSGCRPCWAMIEALGDAANDLVAWSNDLFSYGVERSKDDTHNMVVIIMYYNGLDLPNAAEFVANMCREAIDRFTSLRTNIPCWNGPIVKHDVEKYVQGLANWMSGIIYWSFKTERYFGKAVKTVRSTMVVEITV